MNRRDAILNLLAFGATTGPFTVFAQQSGKPRRIIVYAATPQARLWFLGGLRQLGWFDGQNISLVLASTQEIDENALRFALLDQDNPVALLVMGGARRIQAALNVTKTVPIVAIDLESDPVASGFVKNLARPGTNVTGVWMDMPELVGKHFQLMREVIPKLRRLGILWDDRFVGPQVEHVKTAAQALKLTLSSVAIHGAGDVAGAMERTLSQRPEALLVLSSPTIFASLQQIAELARDNRLPSICLFSNYADVGGFLSYGPDFASMYRQTADYANRILNGAKVGDLPIERPTKFELAFNLKTANAIGITIPPSLRLRADRVIE
jgi:putative ABC transport system substrate-binding protein